jgi:hypothetical protein
MSKPGKHSSETCDIPFCKDCLAQIKAVAEEGRRQLGEVLTPDEQLTRHERWQGEARDLPTAIRELAKTHHLASDETIDDSEDWYDFVDELAVAVQQIVEALGNKEK